MSPCKKLPHKLACSSLLRQIPISWTSARVVGVPAAPAVRRVRMTIDPSGAPERHLFVQEPRPEALAKGLRDVSDHCSFKRTPIDAAHHGLTCVVVVEPKTSG